MRLNISDKIKKDVFISLFHLLKQNTSSISIIFNEEYIYIQGMDNSHVCLFDIKIMGSWFTEYILNVDDELCVHDQDRHMVGHGLLGTGGGWGIVSGVWRWRRWRRWRRWQR